MYKEVADKGVRFINYLIDFLIVLFIYLIVHFIFSTSVDVESFEFLIFQTIYYLYYFLSESVNGQTLGKRYTKTRVVTKSGEPLKLKHLIIRTSFRLAGLDAISYLFGNSVGMHDWFSGTRVMKITSAKS